jgi:hypothetical protein
MLDKFLNGTNTTEAYYTSHEISLKFKETTTYSNLRTKILTYSNLFPQLLLESKTLVET